MGRITPQIASGKILRGALNSQLPKLKLLRKHVLFTFYLKYALIHQRGSEPPNLLFLQTKIISKLNAASDIPTATLIVLRCFASSTVEFIPYPPIAPAYWPL